MIIPNIWENKKNVPNHQPGMENNRFLWENWRDMIMFNVQSLSM